MSGAPAARGLRTSHEDAQRRCCLIARTRDRGARSTRRRRFSRGDPRQAEVHGRQGSGARARPRLAHRDIARRTRSHHRPVERDNAADVSRRPQARLLLLARIPDRTDAVRRVVEPGTRHHGARGARRVGRRLRPAARARARCRARQRRPGSSCRVLHGEHGHARHPRAWLWHSLRSWHLPAGPDGRVAERAARRVACVRQSLGVRAAGGDVLGRIWRTGRGSREWRRRDARGVAARRDRQRGGVRHADPGLARRARQYAAAVVGARGRPAVARRFQSRRSRRRAGRARAARGDFARALSERRNGGGRGLAPAPGILLRVGVVAGPRAAAQGAAWRIAHARRLHGDPAERYASGDRRSRAHAPAGRRTRHAVGSRVERGDEGLQLHEPHAAARSAGNVAGRATRAHAAAAPADHRAHQRAASRCAARGRTRPRTTSLPRCR